MEAPPGIEPGMKVLQTSALPLGYGAIWSGKRGSNPPPLPWQGSALPNELFPQYGASEWSRTTDTGIFSPLLYQLSYRGKNLATRRGLEPLTSSVTGWHSNQLNYRTILFKFKKSWWAFRDSNPGPIGYEPTALTN